MIHLYGKVDDVETSSEELPSYDHDYCQQLSADDLHIVPFYHLISANVDAGLAPNYQLIDEEGCRLYFEGPAAKLIHNIPRVPDEGEVMLIYISKDSVRRTVIEKGIRHAISSRSSST